MQSKDLSTTGHLPKTEKELYDLVVKISQEDFSRPFMHKCRFNSRLRTSGGRYLLESHDLEFNPRYMNLVGFEGLVGTIRHELCHYHLHLIGRGYRHGDQDFKQLLAKVGAPRYAQSTSLKRILPIRYEYMCKQCKRHYSRRRKLDLERYVCGICKSKLTLICDQMSCNN